MELEGSSSTPIGHGPPAIETMRLTKQFRDLIAVDCVSFDVREGEVFGFLGPNGAGKTTTIQMLTGLARPTSGSIRFFGVDYTGHLKKAQHLMGVVPDENNLYPELDGFENLSFCAALYGMSRHEREERARYLLDRFGLGDAAKRKFASYSKGMKRKLVIAAGIIHRPRILFLDEPTTGLDISAARDIRQLLAHMNEEGTTIFLTTHYIEEAGRLCHRIAFIVSGRLVRVDTPSNLMQSPREEHILELIVTRNARGVLGSFRERFPKTQVQVVSDLALRILSLNEIPLAPVVRFFEEQAIQITEARTIRPSMEEVFVRITGIELPVMKREKEKSGLNP
jgi:ABC-2 type transport system ATP-binding protein